MKLMEVIPIKHNNTFFVIGELQMMYVPEDIISSDGFLEIEKANSCCSLGIDGYYKAEKIMRLPYAKAK